MTPVAPIAPKDRIIPLAFLAVLGLLILNLIDVSFSESLSQAPAGSASLSIQYPDGRKRMFVGPVAAKMTVLNAVNSASLGGNFGFRFSIDDSGAVILMSLDNQADRLGDGRWHFYLNGQPIQTGDIGGVTIKERDEIEVKFE